MSRRPLEAFELEIIYQAVSMGEAIDSKLCDRMTKAQQEYYSEIYFKIEKPYKEKLMSQFPTDEMLGVKKEFICPSCGDIFDTEKDLQTHIKNKLHENEKVDNVNHPPHYKNSDIKCSCGKMIECIDVTRHFNFTRGNGIKYVWRAGAKDKAKEIEDLKKAVWYIQDEIKRLENL